MRRKNLSTKGFSISADDRVKMKENENVVKYLHLARELRKSWNMWAMVLWIVVGVLVRTVPKHLKKKQEEVEIWGSIKTIQTTALIKSART